MYFLKSLNERRENNVYSISYLVCSRSYDRSRYRDLSGSINISENYLDKNEGGKKMGAMLVLAGFVTVGLIAAAILG